MCLFQIYIYTCVFSNILVTVKIRLNCQSCSTYGTKRSCFQYSDVNRRVYLLLLNSCSWIPCLHLSKFYVIIAEAQKETYIFLSGTKNHDILYRVVCIIVVGLIDIVMCKSKVQVNSGMGKVVNRSESSRGLDGVVYKLRAQSKGKTAPADVGIV